MSQPDPPTSAQRREHDAPAALPAAAGASLSEALARVAEPDVGDAERGHLLARLASGAGKGAFRALRGPRALVRWALDTLIEAAPHVRVRDLEELRRQHDGKAGEDLAEALVRNAARTTAAIGGAAGGVVAVEWVAPPTLLSAPVLIAVETVAVVAVEVKLLAELHEVYGVPVRGTAAERSRQLLAAWAQRRGVSLLNPARGLTAALGVGVRKELRERIVRRMGRNLTTLGPFLTGAAVAAALNRKATRALGERVRDDLRGRAAPGPGDRPGTA